MNIVPSLSDDEIAAAHREWGSAITTETCAVRSRRNRPPRLRVGYVSADFRLHSVSFFLRPLLREHDRSVVELFCYHNNATEDAITKELQGRAEHWRRIKDRPDAEVAELVQADAIDILVDLGGHSDGNRLPLFARRPAPIQVAYLGYPNTTGLPSMAYRITDAYADPPGETEHWHTEELVRPFASFVCYEPPSGCPRPTEPPFLRAGKITFGSFNELRKVNDDVIEQWVSILNGVPGSRMLLKAHALADAECRALVRRKFSARGVSPERLMCLPREPTLQRHLSMYSMIDIALDTFPYNGTTTTCEALWMGVPVVAIAGRSHRSRVSLSLLTNLGLEELVASSEICQRG